MQEANKAVYSSYLVLLECKITFSSSSDLTFETKLELLAEKRIWKWSFKGNGNV